VKFIEIYQYILSVPPVIFTGSKSAKFGLTVAFYYYYYYYMIYIAPILGAVVLKRSNISNLKLDYYY